MRVNLLINNPGNVRSGYVNIDHFAQPEDPAGRVPGNVMDLDQLVDDGEVEELVAVDILNYCPAAQADEVLRKWLGKLAHQGKLTLGVVDVREVAKGLINNTITPEDVNRLLHGEQTAEWQVRKCTFTLTQLVEVLTNLGYKIISKRVQNYYAFVTCVRP
jgi:hypothetical protein